MPHPRFGAPPHVLRAALKALHAAPLTMVARSSIIASAPIGPSIRTYANAVAIIETALEPLALLAHLQALEAQFGRRRSGQRWRARVLDLDILLWSEGAFASKTLTIPHKEMAKRAFVIGPLAQIAPQWRHPLLGLTAYHLKARLDRRARLA